MRFACHVVRKSMLTVWKIYPTKKPGIVSRALPFFSWTPKTSHATGVDSIFTRFIDRNPPTRSLTHAFLCWIQRPALKAVLLHRRYDPSCLWMPAESYSRCASGRISIHSTLSISSPMYYMKTYTPKNYRWNVCVPVDWNLKGIYIYICNLFIFVTDLNSHCTTEQLWRRGCFLFSSSFPPLSLSFFFSNNAERAERRCRPLNERRCCKRSNIFTAALLFIWREPYFICRPILTVLNY